MQSNGLNVITNMQLSFNSNMQSNGLKKSNGLNVIINMNLAFLITLVQNWNNHVSKLF